jgi:hypothetical protein
MDGAETVLPQENRQGNSMSKSSSELFQLESMSTIRK